MSQRNAGPQSQSRGGGPGWSAGQVGSMPGATTPATPGVPGVPGTSAENVVQGEQHLIFSLLDREFALPAECIQGVERLTDVTVVPNVVSWVLGVLNLRGSICSVVDLRTFLDVERTPVGPRTRLLSVKYNEMLICLVVDSVSEMVPIAPNTINNNLRNVPPWIASYASGTAAVGKRV